MLNAKNEKNANDDSFENDLESVIEQSTTNEKLNPSDGIFADGKTKQKKRKMFKPTTSSSSTGVMQLQGIFHRNVFDFLLEEVSIPQLHGEV